jgi:hypothetical protein
MLCLLGCVCGQPVRVRPPCNPEKKPFFVSLQVALGGCKAPCLLCSITWTHVLCILCKTGPQALICTA